MNSSIFFVTKEEKRKKKEVSYYSASLEVGQMRSCTMGGRRDPLLADIYLPTRKGPEVYVEDFLLPRESEKEASSFQNH